MSNTNAAIATMAANAGDKLKTSAREFLRNLEAWKTQEMQQQHAATGSSTTATTSSRETTLELTLQKMFGACTNASEANHHPEETPYGRQSKRRSNKKINLVTPPATPPSQQRKEQHQSQQRASDPHEHIYEQLFIDDTPPPPKTIKATFVQREPSRLTVQTDFPSPKQAKSKSKQPQATMTTFTKPSTTTVKTPLGANHLIVPNHTFDDSISAVSAHTLEAMAQADTVQASESNDSSLFPSSSRETTPAKTTTPPKQPPKKSRLSPGQVEKQLLQAPFFATSSWGHRKRSENTHTTHTTEDSSTDHQQWRNCEQAFWDDQVKSTTKACSHPHETIPFDAGETAFSRDPDRIDQVLVLAVDTELAEI